MVGRPVSYSGEFVDVTVVRSIDAGRYLTYLVVTVVRFPIWGMTAMIGCCMVATGGTFEAIVGPGGLRGTWRYLEFGLASSDEVVFSEGGSDQDVQSFLNGVVVGRGIDTTIRRGIQLVGFDSEDGDCDLVL